MEKKIKKSIHLKENLQNKINKNKNKYTIYNIQCNSLKNLQVYHFLITLKTSYSTAENLRCLTIGAS